MNPLILLQAEGTYGLKPRFQNLTRPFARWVAAHRISANQVTVFTSLASASLGLFLASHVESHQLFLAVPAFLFLRMVLNATDGIMAREFNQQSKLGAYLNELGDVFSDVFCYLPFVFLPQFSPFLMGAVILLAMASEFAGAMGPMVGASRRYEGPLGKSDRALVFGALGFWLGIGGPLGYWPSFAIPAVLIGLSLLTITARVRGGLLEVQEETETVLEAAQTAMREEREHYFHSHDGARLFYRHWPAMAGSCDKAILLLHRGHEHSGRLQHLVAELNLPEVAMFAWDARGHGLSPLPAGSSPSLGTFVKDLDTFVKHISNTYGIPIENIAIISQSVGSVLAAAWVHDYAPKIRCMVLAAPAFKVKLYVPFARVALRLLHSLIGEFHVNSYVKAGALTHDPQRIASYKKDPFITRPISVRVLLGLYSTSDRIVADSQAIQTPIQLLISGRDFVVRRKPQLQFFESLGTTFKEKHVFDGFFHDILGEQDRHLAITRVRQFIERAFTTQFSRTTLCDADRTGFTKHEFDRLSQPLPWLSLRHLKFALAKCSLQTAGRLSEGIRLGLKTGFDSGSSLDYVYRNQPSGHTFLGKTIDWFYLNAAGWRGVRERKQRIVCALLNSMADLRRAERPVRIIDIAAGHGSYVLDALELDRAGVDGVLLRDFDEANVAAGSKAIEERSFAELVRFEKGDAFDRKSLSELKPRATIGIVSGLYELFPENYLVRESIAGLRNVIEPGGFLVYTGQPFHPQLEFIARTLHSHRNRQPWIMRRRTQAEMDQLVEEAGFQKVDQWIDDNGIFSVSVAEKVSA